MLARMLAFSSRMCDVVWYRQGGYRYTVWWWRIYPVYIPIIIIVIFAALTAGVFEPAEGRVQGVFVLGCLRAFGREAFSRWCSGRVWPEVA